MARVMEITTALGTDVVLFHRMHAREEMGRLFEYDLDLLSRKVDVDIDSILATNATVKIELPGGGTRWFNGYVTRFSQVGMHGRYHAYRASIRPWLWFMTRRTNCRIFQELTVPEIIKKIFDDYSIADFSLDGLTDTYPKREYCVQYRETDFNFVSRLMEEEGIYYFFKHADGKHTLMLADSYSAHAPYGDYAQIPFLPVDRTPRLEKEYVGEWVVERKVRPGKFELDDYDFMKPSVDLTVKRNQQRRHGLSDYEVYDYPGKFFESGDGEHYVRARMEESQYQFELCRGKTNSRGLSVGYLFKLTGHPRGDQNREYLVHGANYELEYSEYEAMDNPGARYACSFEVLQSQQPFRSRRLTRRPVVEGPQTAVVVGPEGDEIYTDKYGRVKLQFHWDREGKRDENSSCWVRVSHPWAGKNWGMIAIPRIGQEVVVDFLEGDPDRPLITGRVYNEEQMPPYDLPAHKSTTGIKSRVTKEGEQLNFNELRFEDDKGKEHIYLHGEKNMTTVVENSETHTVGNDLSTRVANNESHMVGKVQTELIGVGRNTMIGAFDNLAVGGVQNVAVGGMQNIGVGVSQNTLVGAKRTLSVGGNDTTMVKGRQSVSIGGSHKLGVGGRETVFVKGARSTTIGGSDRTLVTSSAAHTCAKRTDTVAGGYTLTVGVKRSASIVGQDLLDVKGQRETKVLGPDTTTVTGPRSATVTTESVTSTTTMSLTAGATISLSTTGTVTITSSGTTIAAAGPVSITAPTMTLSAGAITLASPMVQVAGVLQAVTVIAGSVVSPTYTPGAGNLF